VGSVKGERGFRGGDVLLFIAVAKHFNSQLSYERAVSFATEGSILRVEWLTVRNRPPISIEREAYSKLTT
jgi:hypothetical protein